LRGLGFEKGKIPSHDLLKYAIWLGVIELKRRHLFARVVLAVAFALALITAILLMRGT
jgi:hypothetical protein